MLIWFKGTMHTIPPSLNSGAQLGVTQKQKKNVKITQPLYIEHFQPIVITKH